MENQKQREIITQVYGFGYFKTSQGLLKTLETITCLAGLCLVVSGGWSTHLINANVVGTSAGLCVSIFLLIVYVSKTGRPLEGLLPYHIYFNFIWFIYLLIVSPILIAKQYNQSYTIGASCGLIAAILYLIDTIDCYKKDPTPLFCLGL